MNQTHDLSFRVYNLEREVSELKRGVTPGRWTDKTVEELQHNNLALAVQAHHIAKALEDIRKCLYYSRKPAHEILREIDDISFAAITAYKENR